MKIAHKMSLSFLFVALVCGVAVLGPTYLIVQNYLTGLIMSNLEETVRSRTSHIQTYLKMSKASVVQASKSVVLPKVLKMSNADPGYKEALENATKLLKSKREGDVSVYQYLLLDASGRVVAASDEAVIVEDKSADSIFLGAQKDVYLKDAYFLSTLQMPLMAISAPLFDSNGGAFLGVLAARIKLDELNNILTGKIGSGKGGEIYIINKYGYMITPSRFLKDTFLREKVVTKNARRVQLHKGKEHILSEEKILDVFPDYRGVSVLGTHDYIPEMHWGVLAEIDAKEAFVPLGKLRIVFLWGLFFAVAVAGILGIFVSKFITGPLHQLHKGTEIIGSGDLDHKVGMKIKDEVGQLSQAIDSMTENLKNSLSSVENLNRQVDARKKAEEELNQMLKEERKNRRIMTSMLDDNNQVAQKLGENIKELKRSQNMMINSEKLASLGRLVSEIAHEVNNPLMIISGNAQLSLMEESIGLEEKKSFEIIVKECQRAKDVIRRVLRFARPSKGDVKEVDINQSIESVVGIQERQFMLSSNVEIKRNYLEKAIYISVDENQMQEVFMNLLNNAKEAMPKGGVITLTTSLDGGAVRIDFKDTGQGMSDEVMRKIMEPFFTTKETGTGIGLAVCYGIVKAHGGELRFESELGMGTTATILLPRGGGNRNG